jgi:hypothetical protein
MNPRCGVSQLWTATPRTFAIVSPPAVSGCDVGHEIVAKTRRAGFGLLMPAIILGLICGAGADG